MENNSLQLFKDKNPWYTFNGVEVAIVMLEDIDGLDVDIVDGESNYLTCLIKVEDAYKYSLETFLPRDEQCHYGKISNYGDEIIIADVIISEDNEFSRVCDYFEKKDIRNFRLKSDILRAWNDGRKPVKEERTIGLF